MPGPGTSAVVRVFAGHRACHELPVQLRATWSGVVRDHLVTTRARLGSAISDRSLEVEAELGGGSANGVGGTVGVEEADRLVLGRCGSERLGFEQRQSIVCSQLPQRRRGSTTER